MRKQYIKPVIKIKAIQAGNLLTGSVTSITGLSGISGTETPTYVGESTGQSVGAKSFNAWEDE